MCSVREAYTSSSDLQSKSKLTQNSQLLNRQLGCLSILFVGHDVGRVVGFVERRESRCVKGVDRPVGVFGCSKPKPAGLAPSAVVLVRRKLRRPAEESSEKRCPRYGCKVVKERTHRSSRDKYIKVRKGQEGNKDEETEIAPATAEPRPPLQTKRSWDHLGPTVQADERGTTVD